MTRWISSFALSLGLCACEPSDVPHSTPAPVSSKTCLRSGLTTAPTSLLDALKGQLSKLESAVEKEAQVASFLAKVTASGGTPLTDETGERVVFVTKGHPQTRYSAAGSWNGWNAGMTSLSALEGTDLYVADVRIPRQQAHAYKLVDGSRWFEDVLSENILWDGIDRNYVGEFNAVVFPSLLDEKKGRLKAFRGVFSRRMNDRRDVFVYVPPAYDADTCPSLPSLYFHDGNESLTRAPFTFPADEWYAAHPEDAALLVFVALPSQDVRMAQYTFGEGTRGNDYVGFLSEELVPKIDLTFRTCVTAENRGVAGASLGGLISAHAAFSASTVFGYVGAQSASFFWQEDAMVKRAASMPVLPIRFYVDHGTPNDNSDVSRRMVAALSENGYEVKHVEEAGAGHEWAAWQKRLPGLLSYFREGRSRCFP